MLGGGFLPLIEQMYCLGGVNFGETETYTLDTGMNLTQPDAMTNGRFNV